MKKPSALLRSLGLRENASQSVKEALIKHLRLSPTELTEQFTEKREATTAVDSESESASESGVESAIEKWERLRREKIAAKRRSQVSRRIQTEATNRDDQIEFEFLQKNKTKAS